MGFFFLNVGPHNWVRVRIRWKARPFDIRVLGKAIPFYMRVSEFRLCTTGFRREMRNGILGEGMPFDIRVSEFRLCPTGFRREIHQALMKSFWLRFFFSRFEKFRCERKLAGFFFCWIGGGEGNF